MRNQNRKTVTKKSVRTTPPTPLPSIDQKPSIIGAMIQGFGFGIGSSVARQAVDSVMNSTTVETPTPQKKDNCDLIFKNLSSCLESSNPEFCKNFLEEYSKCKSN